MQYRDKVTFVHKVEGAGVYDPDIGGETQAEPDKQVRLAHVVTPSDSKSVMVYGDLKAKYIIVHLKQPYYADFDYIEFKGNKFYLETDKSVNSRQILTLKGQNNGI